MSDAPQERGGSTDSSFTAYVLRTRMDAWLGMQAQVNRDHLNDRSKKDPELWHKGVLEAMALLNKSALLTYENRRQSAYLIDKEKGCNLIERNQWGRFVTRYLIENRLGFKDVPTFIPMGKPRRFQGSDFYQEVCIKEDYHCAKPLALAAGVDLSVLEAIEIQYGVKEDPKTCRWCMLKEIEKEKEHQEAKRRYERWSVNDLDPREGVE